MNAWDEKYLIHGVSVNDAAIIYFLSHRCFREMEFPVFTLNLELIAYVVTIPSVRGNAWVTLWRLWDVTLHFIFVSTQLVK